MRDINAAYRVGYVAALGLLAAHITEHGTPYADVHTPWTNYVPAWVDEAKLQDFWRQGWDKGIKAYLVLADIRVTTTVQRDK